MGTIVHGDGTTHETSIAALRDYCELALVAVLEDARDLLHSARLKSQPACMDD
jgi:hypothetical protein